MDRLRKTGNGKRQTAGFNGIENFGDFKVIVNKGTTINLSLYGEDNVLGEIVTEVSNNKLKIRYQNHNYRHRHNKGRNYHSHIKNGLAGHMPGLNHKYGLIVSFYVM
ncbi:MAG: DUF2807 domain-containing protein [Chitinophagaceae bacterium]